MSEFFSLDDSPAEVRIFCNQSLTTVLLLLQILQEWDS